jgi:hypothetical protein
MFHRSITSPFLNHELCLVKNANCESHYTISLSFYYSLTRRPRYSHHFILDTLSQVLTSGRMMELTIVVVFFLKIGHGRLKGSETNDNQAFPEFNLLLIVNVIFI